MMLSVLDYRCGELLPTASYARRSWCWIPANREHPEWDRRLGNLTLKVQHASGYGAKCDLDTYAIEELDPIFGIGRVFLLVNLTDLEQSQPYQVTIGDYELCTCQSGKCKQDCKHSAAIVELIESGILDNEERRFSEPVEFEAEETSLSDVWTDGICCEVEY
jgi:hypothetical protein